MQLESTLQARWMHKRRKKHILQYYPIASQKFPKSRKDERWGAGVVQVSSLLGEIFMEPTQDQLEAYHRVLAKGRVYVPPWTNPLLTN